MNRSKYTANLEMERFIRIAEISYYNNNYYNGFDKDLLFAESDDIDTTKWWLISGKLFYYLGESYTSEGDLLHIN